MDLMNDIPSGSRDKMNVIIEIPKHSRNKLEYDKDLKVFKLDRYLYSPMIYPGNYGFVPRTLEEDGDPLDVLILASASVPTGTLVEAKPIGFLEMIDGGDLDRKVLAVAEHDPRFNKVEDVSDVPEHFLKEIAHFFKVYKELEGKEVDVRGWHGASEAMKAFDASVKAFNEKRADSN